MNTKDTLVGHRGSNTRHSRDVRSLCMPAVTIKLNIIPREGICSGLSLSRGKTALLVRFTPNAVSLEAALTKENGPLPSSTVKRDNTKKGVGVGGQDKAVISEQVINAEGLKRLINKRAG